MFVAGADWYLSGSLDRRTLLKGATSAALGLLASATGSSCGAASPAVGSPPGAGPSPAASNGMNSASETSGATPQSAASESTDRRAGGETVYVFNVGSKDVTLIDAATRKVSGTRPLGAQVRWLSNEQTYWDGQSVWTYDFPDNKLQAIAIDPTKVEVSRKIEGIGTGPGHSLVILPDTKKAMVNVAGDNVVAFLDLPSGKIDGTMKTGAFP